MIAVITGASSGIGASLAQVMMDRGYTVVGAARRTTEHSWCKVVDVSVEQECRSFIRNVIAEHGGIDVLVNNAGRGHYTSIEDTPTQLWREMFALNIDSMFWTTQETLPSMRARNSGAIINIASTAGRFGFPYNAAYVAAKHAVVGFTAALRAELLGTNIYATVVSPAGVATEWQEATAEGSQRDLSINDLYAGAIPRSRVIAREQELSLAPLSKMMSSLQAAEIIMDTVESGRVNDVYTHDGTQALAEQAVTNRIELEDRHKALFLAMHEVYQEHHKEHRG